MTPLSLTLKGFRGIRDGLGRDEFSLDLEQLAGDAQLVAIAGGNGRGKTTLMDNLHPYLTMPSRAGAAGPGGFSYYDHVYLPESEKDLIWIHDGARYRSHVIFRLNGKRRTEAFLFKYGEHGWEPLQLACGTLSDGKVETYGRCVEVILGSAETFFTSVFSAQGKRQLTAYKNAEIKDLLGDLLGLDEIRLAGQKATEVAKQVKAGIAAMRREQGSLDDEVCRIDTERERFVDAGAGVTATAAAKQAAQHELEVVRAIQAQLAAERNLTRRTELRRAELCSERERVTQAARDTALALDRQEARERQRLNQLQRGIAGRDEQVRLRRSSLETKCGTLARTLLRAGAVIRACRRKALAERAVAGRNERVAQLRRSVQVLAELQARARAAMQQVAAIEREAGQASLKAEELARRLHLTKEVPCFGSDMQGRCQLLGDARDAKTLIPSADRQIARLAQKKSAASDGLAALRARQAGIADAPARLDAAERLLEMARARASRYAVLAAQRGEIEQTKATLLSVQQELAAINDAGSLGETTEEFVERQQIGATCQAIAAQREKQTALLRQAQERIAAELTELPAPYDERRYIAAMDAVERATVAVAVAEQAHITAVQDAQSLALADRRASELAARQTRLAAHTAAVEAELGNWMLFAKCLSNDGVIALAIDDAGPALSGLANDLLLASYGPRFTVSIKTLVETAKGEPREGFDIEVHDAECAESKSVGLMSGGERVWINECLVRAVALYLAQSAGRHYATLFSDEADGPLDPERKRMFMAMKREVLRLGGYGREFFVSQTPDLTAMADAVIDMDAPDTDLGITP